MRKIIGSLMISYCFIFCGEARAELSAEIEKIPIGIESMLKCGAWKEENSEGFNRFIFAYADGHSEVYVQWIDVGVDYSSEHDDKMLASIIVKEFADHAAYSISAPKCKLRSDGKGIVLFNARNANEEDGLYEVELTAEKVGIYKLKWKEIKRISPK